MPLQIIVSELPIVRFAAVTGQLGNGSSKILDRVKVLGKIECSALCK